MGSKNQQKSFREFHKAVEFIVLVVIYLYLYKFYELVLGCCYCYILHMKTKEDVFLYYILDFVNRVCKYCMELINDFKFLL